MSGFSAASVAALSYDFRAFPKDDDSGERCTGKGTTPEPSKARLDDFYKGFAESFGALSEAAPEDADLEALAEERGDKMYQLLADVCGQKPSVDELKELPPRILAKYTTWLLGELSPKG